MHKTAVLVEEEVQTSPPRPQLFVTRDPTDASPDREKHLYDLEDQFLARGGTLQELFSLEPHRQSCPVQVQERIDALENHFAQNPA